MTRDESLKLFAATRVMGWEWVERAGLIGWFKNGRLVADTDWNPLESGDDSFRLWEEARKNPQALERVWLLKLATPRAITEAICTAFGWKENDDA